LQSSDDTWVSDLRLQDPGTLTHSLQMTAFQSVQQQVPAAAPERATSVDSLDSPAMAAAMAESAAAGAILMQPLRWSQACDSARRLQCMRHQRCSTQILVRPAVSVRQKTSDAHASVQQAISMGHGSGKTSP